MYLVVVSFLSRTRDLIPKYANEVASIRPTGPPPEMKTQSSGRVSTISPLTVPFVYGAEDAAMFAEGRNDNVVCSASRIFESSIKLILNWNTY